MLRKGLLVGFLAVGMLLGHAGAEELLPAGVVNVALPEFRGHLGAGSDYGLANGEPVEVRKGMGREPEIRILRTSQEFRLSRDNEARFQVRLGEVEGIYFWIESPPVIGRWGLNVSAVYPDGYRELIFSQTLLREAEYFVQVPPRSLLEFRVTSNARNLRLRKRFILTVSPVHLSLWSDSRPVPSTHEGGAINP